MIWVCDMGIHGTNFKMIVFENLTNLSDKLSKIHKKSSVKEILIVLNSFENYCSKLKEPQRHRDWQAGI